MANATYDNMWQEAMADLGEQLHVEGVEGDDEGGDAPKLEPIKVTIFQAFQHFACLYIKYLQIFRKLEGCYDNVLHPQKRLHVKKVLEMVIRRVLELKSDLVRWNPPNSFVRMPQGEEEAFPWEYVHLDDILVDLKLSPDTLEIPIPKYFREDNIRQIEQRDRLVSGYMRLKHNTDKIYITDQFETPVYLESMTLDQAIEVIQRNERGRQGIERSIVQKAARDSEISQTRMYADTSAHMEMDGDIAATNIQRMMKGFVSRKIAATERDNELKFVGMRPRKDNVETLQHELDIAYRKRKQEQAENKDGYERALEDLKGIILDEEGPEKREEFREERTLWITDQIAQEKFPEDLNDFYAAKFAPPEEADDGGAGGKDAKGKGGKGGKDDKKGKDAKKDKDGKGKKGKGKGKVEDVNPEDAMPKLQGKTELTEHMAKMVQLYEETWEGRDEADNFKQKHDSDLAKAVVRPNVYEEVRKQVDDMLVMNLKKIQLQLAPKGKKGKKGKKKGKKKKGKKDKKKKPLPGEKIAELKGLDADHMLSVLIENQLVVRPRTKPLSTLVGDFNYLGSTHHNADRKDEGKWQPQDPSMSQLRQAISEYCILPIGSTDIRAGIEPKKLIKSIMLYGPSGAGKTHAVEAVAHELGALLIHLSPEKLRGQFPGKTGPTKLVHMVMTVARDPAMQPAVICIDDCEAFFSGGKKNKDKDGPSRFKKDLLLYKNQALGPEHRVIIIGLSKQPENGDIKDMRSFFDKFLYFPYPDYASRCLVWKYYLEQQVRDGLHRLDDGAQNVLLKDNKVPLTGATLEEDYIAKIRAAILKVDVSSLSHISEGYSAGAIARTVRAIITSRRVAVLKQRPLATNDFIDNLALQDVTYQDDQKAFAAFTAVISGLDDRRKKIESIISGEADAKKDKKGGKDKKGKK